MFDATPVHSSHAIDIPLPIDACFALFTPQGETLWIADWKPDYLHPADGATMQGMVFLTHRGGETTYWTLVDYKPHLHYSRYCRVTPGSRSVLVEVQCARLAAETTRVTVSYTLVPLSAEGSADIEAFRGEAYVAMIEGWRTLILRHLAGRAGG